MRLRFILLVLILGAISGVVLVSCGGSGSQVGATSGSGGSATFRIIWPERGSTRLLPAASESVRILVLDGDKTLVTKIVPRPAEGVTAVVKIEDLPVKKLTDVITAFPNADATGVAQAEGRAEVEIKKEETARVTVTLASTIDRLEVSPSGPQTVQSLDLLNLTATPRNAAGEQVLIRPKSLQWVSSNLDVATVDAEGGVGAYTPGTATITVTEPESGRTAFTTVEVVERACAPIPEHTIAGAAFTDVPKILYEGETYTIKLVVTSPPPTGLRIGVHGINRTFNGFRLSDNENYYFTDDKTPRTITITFTVREDAALISCRIGLDATGGYPDGAISLWPEVRKR